MICLSHYVMSPFALSNKIDETISLDSLQRLKQAFEVVYNGKQTDSFFVSLRYDSIFLCKGIWNGRLQIHWCNDFWMYSEEVFAENSKTVWHFCLYLPLCQISFCLCSFSVHLCLSHTIKDEPSYYPTNLQKVSLYFVLEFHRAMHKFKDYLRRLIIQAKEGFHGWAEFIFVSNAAFLDSGKKKPFYAC